MKSISCEQSYVHLGWKNKHLTCTTSEAVQSLQFTFVKFSHLSWRASWMLLLHFSSFPQPGLGERRLWTHEKIILKTIQVLMDSHLVLECRVMKSKGTLQIAVVKPCLCSRDLRSTIITPGEVALVDPISPVNYKLPLTTFILHLQWQSTTPLAILHTRNKAHLTPFVLSTSPHYHLF